jgi:hypothetical protein
MSGRVILPVMIDPSYTVDIDSPKDWARSSGWCGTAIWKSFIPVTAAARCLRRVDLVVFDFDGVMTDNRVFVDENGREMVAAYRSDSMGLNYLRKAGIAAVVLSTEINPGGCGPLQKNEASLRTGC